MTSFNIVSREKFILLLMLAGTLAAVKTISKDELKRQIEQKCEEYKDLPDSTRNDRKKNCDDISNMYIDCLIESTGCNNDLTRYENFLKNIPPVSSKDKMMLWSGYDEDVNIKAKQYSATGIYRCLEYTFPGYIVDGLDEPWCFRDYKFTNGCLEANASCPLPMPFSFWTAVSQKFAEQAQGTVTIIFNHFSPELYRKCSTLAKTEIPKLSSNVKAVNVYILDVPAEKTDACAEPTLKNLTNDIVKYLPAAKYSCDDDPPNTGTATLLAMSASTHSYNYDTALCGSCMHTLSAITMSAACLLQLVVRFT